MGYAHYFHDVDEAELRALAAKRGLALNSDEKAQYAKALDLVVTIAKDHGFDRFDARVVGHLPDERKPSNQVRSLSVQVMATIDPVIREARESLRKKLRQEVEAEMAAGQAAEAATPDDGHVGALAQLSTSYEDPVPSGVRWFDRK